MKKFSCVQGCSDCCTYREYYPSVEYGKIGVLLLPEEKAAMERLAKKMKVKVKILPRLAVGREYPERIIAYQMMGKSDGDWRRELERELGKLARKAARKVAAKVPRRNRVWVVGSDSGRKTGPMVVMR